MFFFPPSPAEPARTRAQYFGLVHHMREAHRLNPMGDRNHIEAAHAKAHGGSGEAVGYWFPHPVVVVMSGGQTGVDRAALDWALAAGFPCGGFCPAERLAEDGRIPDRYPLTALNSKSYPPRTRKNIATSDGTVIFAESAQLEGGTALTAAIAHAMSKPLLVLTRGDVDGVGTLKRWMSTHRVFWLNVAGPRASKGADLTTLVWTTLDAAVAARAGPDAKDLLPRKSIC